MVHEKVIPVVFRRCHYKNEMPCSAAKVKRGPSKFKLSFHFLSKNSTVRNTRKQYKTREGASAEEINVLKKKASDQNFRHTFSGTFQETENIAC